MSYLLDTSVLSESRKPRRDEGAATWLSSTPAERRYISALTVGEIERGITRLAQRGDHRQAAVLARWLDDVVAFYDGRIISIDGAVAREWGRLSVTHPLPVVDALIAATAKVRGWTLVTRNVKDVERTGVRLLNPFSV